MLAGLFLGPRSIERPADAGYTFVGTLGSQEPSRVDGGGLVQPFGVPWSVDWQIGAEDRWYFPAREATVRQRRNGAGAVLETAVRIPSGDAVQRVYSVNVAGGDATIIEIRNDSPVAVALLVSIRPYDVYGVPAELDLEIATDRIIADGRTALMFPKPAAESQASTTEDPLSLIGRGQTLDGKDRARGLGAAAAAVFPLPHGASLQFVVPHPAAAYRLGPLPDADAVARGWSAVIEAGGRFSFPDPGITQQALAARARLLAETHGLPARISQLDPGAGRVLEALALSGAVGEIMGSLGALAGTFPTEIPGGADSAAAIISGVGRAARLVDDRAVAQALLEPVAQLTFLVEKQKDPVATNEALLGLCRLLIAAGQRNVALELLPRVTDLSPGADIPGDIEQLVELAEQANPAGSWGGDDEVRAAQFWLGTRRMIIGGDPRHLQLLPQFPPAWRGGEVEVHDAATTHGMVSFAVRWHGERPALLWDLKADEQVEICCPGLDPDWSTTESKGEALLAGTSLGLGQPPSAGDSFA